MKRTLLLLALCATLLPAQPKKILVMGDAEVARELQSVSDKVRVVNVTRDTLAGEIADADAVVGEVRPQDIRAAKKLKWVQTMSAGVERVLHLSGGADLRDSTSF